MTRSIFDPGGGETERSGSAFKWPEAQNASKMPPDVIDGEAEAADTDLPPPVQTSEQAAENLTNIQPDEPAPFEGADEPNPPLDQ